MDAEQAERERVQALLDGAVARWGPAKITAVLERGTIGPIMEARERVERAEREKRERRWRRRYLASAEYRAREAEREEALLADDPPIHDTWRRLHETGFCIEFEKPRRRRRV